MCAQEKNRSLLEGLTSIFHRHEAPADPAPEPETTGYTDAAASLEVMLRDLSERAEAQRQAERLERAKTSGRIAGLAKEDKQAVKAQRVADAHERIRRAVLETHRQLGTSIDDAELSRLETFMHEIGDMINVSPSQGVEPAIRAAVARRFFAESGPLAWAQLSTAMDQAGEVWPASDPNLRAHAFAEAAELFNSSGPAATTDLLIGVVNVWQDHYPEPESSLWRSLCLRAVGAALRAKIIERGVEYCRANADDLRAKGEALILYEAETVRKALASGIRSVEDADRVMAGAAGLLERVIPDICWDAVRRIVEDHASDAR